MDKKTYIVTAKAGPRVAGRVVTKGQTLALTDTEAEYERLLGTIALKGDADAAPAGDDDTPRRSKKS